MLTLAVLSPIPGSGKTVVLVNLAVGLQRKGYRVLLVADRTDMIIRPWLKPITKKNISPRAFAEKTSLGTDLFIKPDSSSYSSCLSVFQDVYDYLLVDAGSDQTSVCADIIAADIILACVEAGAKDNQVFELDKQIRQLSQGARGIDIIVPSKARAGEWESNVGHLMELTDNFGEEKIADFIPFCEAIHDLPREKKAVWDLPGHYSNRKQAFDRLVNKVLNLST